MERRKHIRIKSKFRFITFLVLLILVLGIGFGRITGIGVANGVNEPEYATVEVNTGDTLWNIAERYASNDQDVREVVYKISRINDLDQDTITAGQTIKVPLE